MIGSGMREESGTKRERALFMGKWGNGRKWHKRARAMTLMKRDTKWTDRLDSMHSESTRARSLPDECSAECKLFLHNSSLKHENVKYMRTAQE